MFVTYSISLGGQDSEGNTRFAVDPLTGTLTTVGRWPFACTAPYEVTVSAQIIGMDPLSKSTPTQVIKVFCNERKPQFYQDPYNITIDELAKPEDV